MRRLVLVLAVMLVCIPVFAGNYCPEPVNGVDGKDGVNGIDGVNGQDLTREHFKFGEHINFEYGITDSISLDSHNTYFNEGGEFVSTVGATIKFGKK